jgi:hypothetical protein
MFGVMVLQGVATPLLQVTQLAPQPAQLLAGIACMQDSMLLHY